MTEMIQRLCFTALIVVAVQARPATIEAEVEDYEESEYNLPLDFGMPQNLKVIGSTSTTLQITWEMDVDMDIIDSYRVYSQQRGFGTDVKTLHNIDPEYTLQDLKPFATYLIQVTSIINGTESEMSEAVAHKTDVLEPSAPKILNVTCYGTGQIYVEWGSPQK